jgi:hypothetical protein
LCLLGLVTAASTKGKGGWPPTSSLLKAKEVVVAFAQTETVVVAVATAKDLSIKAHVPFTP